MQSKSYYVYILASKPYGTLYIGVTSNILARIYHHKEKILNGFSKKYSVCKLVYWEQHTEIREAIQREKQIKKWNREWKISLIEQNNPQWVDLYYELLG